MPTKRTRKSRFRIPDIDPYHWALLTDAEIPDPIPAHWNGFSGLTFHSVEPMLWKMFRDRILADWIAAYPGTRPRSWWRLDAPRDPQLGEGWYYQPEMIQGRRLLEGKGRPAWEKYNIVPRWRLGIPVHWTGGDPDELVFESQRDYLKRHGLLFKGEGSSIEPEIVPSLMDF